MTPSKAFCAAFMLISLTAAGAKARAASDGSPIDPSCKAQPIQDPLVKGRAQTITFPNGRQITVVGHLHGKRQIHDISDKELSGELARMSNRQFENYIKNILKTNTTPLDDDIIESVREKKLAAIQEKIQIDASDFFDEKTAYDLQNVTVLNHAEQDFKYLHKRIKDHTIQFVGYEGSEKIWRGNFYYDLHAQQAVWAEFFRRNQSSHLDLTYDQVQKAILSGSNGSVFVYMQDPKLVNVIPMVGIEDPVAVDKYSKADPLVTIDTATSALTAADNKYWSSRSKAELEAFQKRPVNQRFVLLLSKLVDGVANRDVTSVQELDHKMAIINRYGDHYPWMQEALRNVYLALKARVSTTSAREYYQAKNLSGLYATGVDFVGLNHLSGIINNLEQLCTQEVLTPAPLPTTYTSTSYSGGAR